MVGIAAQLPVLAALGFLAALYHVLNHAFFKGLLYLGAGAVINRVGTQDLNRMGGLAKRMPLTALTFLIGAVAVSAIPPFNGFISEWFTYQSLFSAAQTSLFEMRVFAPLFAVLLALAGALAVMVYVKAYGSAFSGPSRSQPAADAVETSPGALVSLVYMALGCLILGIGAPWIAPWIAGVVSSCSCTGAGGIQWLAGVSRTSSTSCSFTTLRDAVTAGIDGRTGFGGCCLRRTKGRPANQC